MKTTGVQSFNIQKCQPSFKAGVTNLFSDFDGTYMPIEWGHDAFCKYENSPKRTALLRDKKPFQDYFDAFKNFLKIAKSENGDKFNFTLTTGRNRFEYNFLMEKVRQEGLSMPTPDRFIVNNGGDVFTPVADFFQSEAKEVFPAANFVSEKREVVKTLTNGWDGDKMRGKISALLNKGGLEVFDVASDGIFYDGAGLKDMHASVGNNRAALREDWNLGFHINLSENLSSDKVALSDLERTLCSKLKEGGVQVYSKSYKASGNNLFATIKLLPKIDGDKIDKVIDTKAEVERIVKGRLNDLVITAGDSSNDARMLNFFEYIGGSRAENFNAENLRKIYKLPLISIYVDNSSKDIKEKVISRGKGVAYDKIDNYFNSDGNVRFIHVDPTNPLKPKNLQEALPIAIKEYAKRNKAFRKSLPKEMRELIDNLNYEYPIDREVSKMLEEQAGTKLWIETPGFKEKFRAVIKDNAKVIAGVAAGVTLFGLGIYLFKKMKNKNMQTNINYQPNNNPAEVTLSPNISLLNVSLNTKTPEVFKNFKVV